LSDKDLQQKSSQFKRRWLLSHVPWNRVVSGRLFSVTHVSPYIPGLFGDALGWQTTGSDSVTTSVNIFHNGGKADTSSLGGGSITYQTPVPEPGTMV
jgi:hypothetical protein